jgi:uncharacterized membrane protein
MQGWKRKLVYVSLYELIAVTLTGIGLYLFSSSPAAHAGLAAVLSSVIAVLWNLVYNTQFERWEARRAVRGRSTGVRIVHALGFEIGLTIMLVPLFAWILGVTLWAALLFDIGAILFFLVYTYAFNLAFDKLFGLPASASGRKATDD